MKLPELLIAIGLSKNEAEMYLTLLENGNQTISAIAKNSTLHRPAIYQALPTLKEKGLVSQRRVGKLIHYAAESPERLKLLLDEVKSELDDMIPQLSRMQSKNTPIVRRLDGAAGVRAVFDDIVHTLNKGDVFYRISSEGSTHVHDVELPQSYFDMRNAKQLERFVISNADYVESREPKLEVAMKVVPKEFLPFDYHISQIIYGNKVAFIDYRQPIATIIENPTLAAFQRDVFKMLFSRL